MLNVHHNDLITLKVTFMATQLEKIRLGTWLLLLCVCAKLNNYTK